MRRVIAVGSAAITAYDDGTMEIHDVAWLRRYPEGDPDAPFWAPGKPRTMFPDVPFLRTVETDRT